MKRKKMVNVIAIGTVFCICMNLILENTISASNVLTRTVSLENQYATEKSTGCLMDEKIEYDKENEIVTVTARSNHPQNTKSMLDNLGYHLQEDDLLGAELQGDDSQGDSLQENAGSKMETIEEGTDNTGIGTQNIEGETAEEDQGIEEEIEEGIEEDKRIEEDEQKEGVIEDENGNVLLEGEDEDDWDEDDWVVDDWDEDGIDLEEEELEVAYECSFDMNELEFCLTTELVTQEGEVLATEKDYTDAIITEYGGLDARVEINGETYLLSDYEDNEALDNCLITIRPLLDILKVYMKTRKEAYDRKVKSNLSYNRKLERDGNGVKKGKYVMRQNDVNTPGRKAGNYRFGFTSFAGVGCEVAAAYNAMINFGKPEKLSSTIYCFEVWGIELRVANGYAGSNPFEIYRYFDKRGVKYEKYYNFQDLKRAVNKRKKCRIVMSRWNSRLMDGLHTFFIRKTGKAGGEAFKSFNWNYEPTSVSSSSLDTFNNGLKFFVGYIIWL